MRRLAIALLSAAAGVGVLTRPTPAAARGVRPAPGPVDVLQVSGLFDPIVVDAIDEAIDRSVDRRRPGPRPAGQHPRGGRRPRRDRGADRAHRRGPAADRDLGRPVRRPALRHAGAAARRRRRHRAWRRARGSATSAPRCGRTALRSTSARRRRRCARARSGSATPARLGVLRPAHLRRGHPDDRQHGRRPRRLRATAASSWRRRRSASLDDGTSRRDTTTTVRFAKLGLVDQLFHTVASPPVAYLLLLIGLALLVFEFFTAGVGIAGVVGADVPRAGLRRPGHAAGARLGGGADPRRDVRLRRRRPGRRAPVLDRRRHGADGRRQPVAVRAAARASRCGRRGSRCSPASVASVLAFVVGMPSMVRTRFATPTIGREWMIGELGEVVEAVDPDGVVSVGRARWRARTNRAHAGRAPVSRSGSSPSTASRWRSSRSRAPLGTTASGADVAWLGVRPVNPV